MSKKLNMIWPKVNFIICANFDEFVKAISKTEQIDCFIIEDNYKECSSTDLINKLRNSKKYKKSVISVYTPNCKKIDKSILELQVNYIFDPMTAIDQTNVALKKAILKKVSPVIPKNFNVLVLDNGQEILDLISMYLTELGHAQIDLCLSIKDTKKNLAEKEYDLLLLDWNLDDGTCIDLVEFIKGPNVTSERTKSALTVVITGRNDVDDIMTLLRYGIKDHIIKPFDFSEFEDKLSYAVEKHVKNKGAQAF